MKGAVIIETRDIPNLYDIIVDKHMKFLPKDWGLTIFHSNANAHQVKNINANKINIQVNNLPTDNYNVILTSDWFWRSLLYDKVLIFQSDSELLREGIEEFLEWDYIGSPWKFQQHGGNGGLSLRNRQIMLDCIEKQPYKGMSIHGNEDVYFSNLINKTTGKIAPLQECYKFACESIFKLGTVGYHAIDKHLTSAECEQIKTQYL